MRVLTIGTFDILHWGHLDFLDECLKLGKLTVGVNSDEFVATFKEPPIMSDEERMYAIARLGLDVVINTSNGKDLVDAIHPDILAVGSDWARKDYLSQIGVTQDWLDERHIILAYVPYVQVTPISTSEIKRRVRER